MAHNDRIATRLATEILVVGNGWSAVAAALAARATGHQVLLAAATACLPDELTVALHGDFATHDDPQFAEIVQRQQALGGVRGGWLDAPIGELVVDRLLAERGIEVLLYAVPLRLVEHGSDAAGVLFGGKDGCYVIAAGAVVDATGDGVLFRESGVAFTAPNEIRASRCLYLQYASEDLTSLHREVDGCQLTARPTWPGEMCVTATGRAAFDGELVPAELHHQARLAVWPIAAELTAHVPGLAGAVVSHTSHRLLPHNGRRLRTADAAHPRLGNCFGAGAWVTGEGWIDPDDLCHSGTSAGRAAAGTVRPLYTAEAQLPAAMDVDCDVLVAGGGTGGPLAALGAARQGARTVLLEAGWALGGIGTNGGIHIYYHGVRGGLQDELDEQVTEVTGRMVRGAGVPADAGVGRVVGFSPEAKKIVLERQCLDAGVTVRYGETVVDVVMDGTRLTGILAVAPGRLTRYRAAATVDATGDGDVAARAGAQFILGREHDGLSHAYSLSCGLFSGNKVGSSNFDAGYVDATDVVDLTRARRHALQLYWRAEGFTAANRMLYIAPLLGLRQSRHVIADQIVSLADQSTGRSFAHDVAYGQCHYDNHAYDYGSESDEGMMWCWVLGHWHRLMRHGVPYGALLPTGVDGLVMGCRALGVSHDAHMLFRMQRDMQRVGEAAGTAAGLAARGGVTPRQLDVARLRAVLRETGAVKDDWQSEVPRGTPEELVAALTGEDPTMAAWQLYLHGEAAVPALRQGLATGSEDTRWWCATALAMLGQADGADLLLAALEQRDGRLPLTAKTRLGGTDQVIRGAPRWVAAIPLLGRIGAHEAVPALLAVVADAATEPDTLVAAVRALGRIGDRTAVAPLRELLGRSDLHGEAAFQDSMGGQGQVPRDTRWQLRLAAAEALNALGAPVPEVVEPYLNDERANVRSLAQRLLDETVGERAAGHVERTDQVRAKR